MIRRDAWKLNYYHGQEPQLFNLEEDPHEFENMWNEPEAQPLKLELLQKSFDASVWSMDRGPQRVGPM